MGRQPVITLSDWPLYSGPRSDEAIGHSDHPYGYKVMSDYLKDCHQKYGKDDIRTRFGDFKFLDKLVFSNRVFWIWTCTDEFDNLWHLIQGEGESTHPDRTSFETFKWGAMFAEPYEPLAIIQNEFPEYAGQTGKLN